MVIIDTVMAQKKKILVVDDSETSLYLVRMIFEDNPFIELHLEKDSLQAIKVLKNVLPDLLILDIMMPGMDGFELLEKIKTDKSISHTPILMLSAKQDTESERKALDMKAIDYLKKPIIIEELKSKVISVLELKST